MVIYLHIAVPGKMTSGTPFVTPALKNTQLSRGRNNSQLPAKTD